MAHYDVFISYSRFDSPTVSALIERLHKDVPGINIWYDIEGIESSDLFQKKIIHAIEEADVMICVCSNNSLKSEYCYKEAMYANHLNKKIVPLLLPYHELRDWQLFNFGIINVVDGSKEDEVNHLIENLKSWKCSSESMRKDLTHISTEDKSWEDNGTVSSPFLKPALPYQSKTDAIDEPTLYGSEEKETPQQVNTCTIKGQAYVDMGFPSRVKWATCNLGALTPFEYGQYYAWGEIETRKSYDTDNCATYKKDAEWLRSYGYTGSKNVLFMSHDVARQRWGGTWRLPTSKEIDELLKNTFLDWVMRQGVNGIELQSKINGNRIFVPASGYCQANGLCGVGERGIFWSSSTVDGGYELSYAGAFTSRSFFKGLYNRSLGLSIRPVTD